MAAAWWRFHSRAEPGFSFLAPNVPEVSTAVFRPWRGHGLGARLLGELEHAAGHAGVAPLSLRVEALNPAVRLYRRCGYEEIAVADGTLTMQLGG